MGKDPAFLFYPNDWLGGTIGMTFEEKGAYMELLMMQFNRGHMTEHMIGQVVGQNWSTLKSKFIQDENGLWYNVRLEEEKNKRQSYTESRRNNKSGSNQYTKKQEKESGHMTKHMTGHMENENVNENKDIIEKGNTDEKEIEKQKNISEIISYLNQKTGSSFKPETKETNRLISARIKDYQLEDLKKVIDCMTEKWINDPKMSDYLVPKTLFAEANFEKYLNMANKPKNQQPNEQKQHSFKSFKGYED